MSIQVTIIGLSQIGSSVGLSLGDKTDQFIRIGNDINNNVVKQALKLGVIDKAEVNLPKAVENADIIIFDLPIDELKKTLEIIAQDLKPEVVILDTSPLHVKVIELAKQLLPQDRFFVKFTPSLNPAYLTKYEQGPYEGQKDLFHNGLIAISSMAGTQRDAVKLASDFAEVLGATPYFVDPYECDGLVAMSRQLPILLAAALVNSTVGQVGWKEGGKMADKDYTRVAELATSLAQSKEPGMSVLFNKENVLRVVDNLISSLREVRSYISEEDGKKLNDYYKRADNGFEDWYRLRMTGNWEKEKSAPIPGASETLGGLIGLRRKDKKAS
jgi:prephenate dehydrogenase